MKQLVVGVGDGGVSRNPDAVITTYALGSCIAVMMHDPVAQVAGMVHYMLPESSLAPEKAQAQPWMFADTGVARLYQSMLAQGAEKRRLAVYAAGGAQVIDDNGVFNIGKRNCLALRKALWKAGLVAQVEETGGNLPRTVRLEVASGKVWMQISGQGEKLLARQLERHGAA
ncbi:MAG: chemotaxis protein CheD [Bryobacteraceae bacterium]|nr:chemotaxis protein CheD [Bryobacteraceae bacterium]